MLSLIRNLTRPQCPLHRASAANFSTSQRACVDEQSYGHLADVLDEQARKTPVPPPKSKLGSQPEKAKRRKQDKYWKPLMPHRVVRPHELTYKARSMERRLPTRRAAVGPEPSKARYSDVFHQFDIDPLSQALNPAILASYMSEMGKIYGRNVTGLTFKSQKRIGKAIRRAKMMGVIPILSRPSNSYTWYPKRG